LEGPAWRCRIDANFAVLKSGFFAKARSGDFIRSPSHGPGNTKLERTHLQGDDGCLIITKSAGMGHPPQTAPDQHVANRTDLSSGIHIPQHQERAIGLEMLSRAQGPLVHGQGGDGGRRFGGML
jgi:hypothetical protein